MGRESLSFAAVHSREAHAQLRLDLYSIKMKTKSLFLLNLGEKEEETGEV